MATASELKKKTVAELRVLAREAGIRGYSRMTKEALLEALSTAPHTRARARKRTAAVAPPEGRKARTRKPRTTTEDDRMLAALESSEEDVPEFFDYSEHPDLLPEAKDIEQLYEELVAAVDAEDEKMHPEDPGAAAVQPREPTARDAAPASGPVANPQGAAAPHAEDLGDLPGGYGEDRLALVPRDPEWAFIHWELSDRTWRAAEQAGGPGRAILRVTFESPEGRIDRTDAEVYPFSGRYYARIPSSGRYVTAELGLLDAGQGFHAVLRSDRVLAPRVGTHPGPVRFLTVPPDRPLREVRANPSEPVGRILSEEEYARLYGPSHPASRSR